MRQSLFATPAMTSLKRTLDVMSLSQRVTAHNLANAETEGFVPRRLEFRETLRQAIEAPEVPLVELARTAAAHQFPYPPAPPAMPPIRLVPEPGAGIEDFLIDLVECSYLYQASAKLLGGQYASLHEAIRGRMA